MKKIQKFFRKADKFLLLPILISFFSISSITGLYLISHNKISSQIPLFYSLPWGQSQLATRQQFFILPATLALICLINTLVAFKLHSSQLILKKIIMASLILINLIIVITSLKILFIFI